MAHTDYGTDTRIGQGVWGVWEWLTRILRQDAHRPERFSLGNLGTGRQFT
ncbi:MAG: hypothetical protein SWX82_29915 [Cyanobacteriota bacterium]|nr:hypothetical protein [Cyanobacteriota bacterium]